MNPWKPKRILAAALILCALLSSGMLGAMAEQADQQPAGYPGITVKTVIGYNGDITYLRKLPVEVTLQNDGADFSGVLAMNIFRNEEQYDRYEKPVMVAGGATVVVNMVIEITMRQPKYEMELLVDGQVAAVYPVAIKHLLAPSTFLMGTLGEASLTHMNIATGRDVLKRGEQWQTVPLTRENFPTDAEMLEFFTFLAIDGFDARELDGQQQQALDTWLQKGGIVLVGGGAQASAGYPYFEKYTNISASAPFQGEDATPAILSYLKLAEDPFAAEMMLVEMKGARNAVIKQEGASLLDVTPVGNGYVMTAAFSLSDKPFASWQGNRVLWQRLMLSALGEHYQRIAAMQIDFYSRENTATDAWPARYIEIPSESSLVLPMLLIMVFLVLIGVGSYYLLLKKDKREWLWLTIPVLSILFSLCFAAMSGGTMLNKPVLAIYNYVAKNAAGVVTENAGIGFATEGAAPTAIEVIDGEVLMLENRHYYSGSNGNAAPKALRYTFWQGETQKLIAPSGMPWAMMGLSVRGTNPPEIGVKGSCWFEEDGLHIRLTNEGAVPTREGKIITTYGYCSVDALLPGQSAEYFLEKPEEDAKAKAGTVNGNGNIPIYDGTMLTKVQQHTMGNYASTYAIIYPEYYTDSAAPVSLTRKQYEERTLLSCIYEQVYSTWENGRSMETSRFHFVYLDDSMCRMAFTLNGKPVERTAQMNIIDVELEYNPIGPSGFVKYGVGSVPVYLGEKGDESGPVRGAVITDRYRYFRLSDNPVFCLVLPPEIKNVELSDVDIIPQFAHSDYGMAVYNYKTRKWDDIDMKKTLMTQLDFSAHLNADGEMYAQFEPGAMADSYSEMGVPYMSMEGRLR